MPSEFENAVTDQTEYGTAITAQGAAIIADCILNGKKLPIVEAAAGDGGGKVTAPVPGQTALVNERWRGEIAGVSLSPTTPNMIDVKIVIGDDVGGFTIREMGLYSDTGVLIAVCNTPDTEKVSISGGVSGRLTMLMHILVVDASVLEFSINPSLDVLSRQDVEAALAIHNISPETHQDIRQLALSAAQLEQVYTKEESDGRLRDAIAQHNTDPASHAALRVALAALENRLNTMELKYGTNVSGNPFTVTFGNLSGLVVTGVWNEEYARVEF